MRQARQVQSLVNTLPHSLPPTRPAPVVTPQVVGEGGEEAGAGVWQWFQRPHFNHCQNSPPSPLLHSLSPSLSASATTSAAAAATYISLPQDGEGLQGACCGVGRGTVRSIISIFRDLPREREAGQQGEYTVWLSCGSVLDPCCTMFSVVVL